MIGALWEATPQKWLNISMGVSTLWIGYICASFRGDTVATSKFEEAIKADKRPAILQRPSINSWMDKPVKTDQTYTRA